MEHVFWIIDRKLAGRPGPNSQGWNLHELYDHGVMSILSLDSRGVDSASISKVGFNSKLIELPCVPFPPDETVKNACLAILPEAQIFISQEIRKGNPVLVHCDAGRDRTSMVLSYYLCCTFQLSPEQALAKINKARCNSDFAEGWEQMILSVMRMLRVPDNNAGSPTERDGKN